MHPVEPVLADCRGETWESLVSWAAQDCRDQQDHPVGRESQVTSGQVAKLARTARRVSMDNVVYRVFQVELVYRVIQVTQAFLVELERQAKRDSSEHQVAAAFRARLAKLDQRVQLVRQAIQVIEDSVEVRATEEPLDVRVKQAMTVSPA